MGLMVNGFIEPVTRTLPMEYAVEWSRLIELQMGGQRRLTDPRWVGDAKARPPATMSVMPMRQDCKYFESRTYPNGETVRKCDLDLAPEAPWRCPDDCPKYTRRLADVNWSYGSLVTPRDPAGAREPRQRRQHRRPARRGRGHRQCGRSRRDRRGGGRAPQASARSGPEGKG